MALRLSRLFGNSSEFWLSAQNSKGFMESKQKYHKELSDSPAQCSINTTGQASMKYFDFSQVWDILYSPWCHLPSPYLIRALQHVHSQYRRSARLCGRMIGSFLLQLKRKGTNAIPILPYANDIYLCPC